MSSWDTKSLQDLVGINPTAGTVGILLANTEYSFTLPVGVKKFFIHTRDESSFRLAFITGSVAASVEPFITVPAGSRYYEDLILGTAARLLYVASPVAGKCLEVIYWTG